MKKILTLSSFLFFCFAGCKDHDKKNTEAENDIDAARNFIQAALGGDFKTARAFMLQDSINLDRMKMIENANLSSGEKMGLAEASINIHSVSRRNDSTTIIIYSNSFKNNHDTLKAVRRNGQWLVDFNYLFEHDRDSLNHPASNLSDSTNK